MPIHDSASCSSEDPHFKVRELCQALTGHFTAPDRRRALAHFGRGCPECWQVLTELAELEVSPAFASTREWESARQAGAPVQLALRRCLAFRSMTGSRVEERECFARLRPMHLHALVQACTETNHDKKALAFRRLVLEESRHLALKDRARLISRARSTLEELRDERFEELHPHQMRALRVLGLTYLADDCRVAGELSLARKFLNEAKRLLDAGHWEAEIHASYFEIEADFARAGGDCFEALDCLDIAEKLLKGCEVPGRRAATRVRRGLVRLRFGDPGQAVEEFDAALEEMIPPGSQPRLRLDAWHHTAAAEVRRGRFAAARRALEKAKPLYQGHASSLIQGQCAWLWGVVYLDARQDAQAEQMLLRALALFEENHMVIDAAQTLTDLGRLYVRTGRGDKLAQAMLRFTAMMDRPEARKLSQEKRREIARRIRESGLEAFCLNDDASDEPVN